MVFGLGSGLGFVYIDDPRYSPVHRFNGRAPDLEGKFYRLFNHELAWMGAWRPDLIAKSLDAGRPLLAQTDIAGLPYYEPVHFPMHGIVVVRFDGADAWVADTFSPELQRITAGQLRNALAGKDCPFMKPYRIASVPRIELRIDASLIARSIEITAREMLDPALLEGGIPAMRRLAANAAAWKASSDWAWSARFAYQSIEKRGTGGGGFRTLYARFLEQVAPALPWVASLDAVARMRASSGQWSELAGHCKSAFVEDRPGRLDDAAEVLDKIAISECELLSGLLHAAAGTPLFRR